MQSLCYSLVFSLADLLYSIVSIKAPVRLHKIAVKSLILMFNFITTVTIIIVTPVVQHNLSITLLSRVLKIWLIS